MKPQLCLLLCLFAVSLAACVNQAAVTEIDLPTSTFPPATETLIVTATEEPSATPFPVTNICSPLVDHALVDLPKYVTQPFIPPEGENKELGHHGVDFGYYHRDGMGGPLEGNPIDSALDGTMAGLGYNKVYGNYLVIETPYERLPAELAELYSLQAGQSLYLLYAHMQDPAPFEFFEPIDCGQQIGAVGKSGDPQFVAEAHLHFETRVGQSSYFVEPMAFYDTQASKLEQEEYKKWRSSGEFVPFDPMLLFNFGASKEEING